MNLKKEKRAQDGGRRQINCYRLFSAGVFKRERVNVSMVCV